MARNKTMAMGDDPLACLDGEPQAEESPPAELETGPETPPVSAGAVVLEAVSGIAGVSELKETLAACLGNGSVLIDGSKVESIDTAMLQLLAAFAAKLKDDGTPVEWSEPSPNFVKAAEDLNLANCLGLPA